MPTWLLLISLVALLGLGALAYAVWTAGDEPAPPQDETAPDKSGERLVWRPGDGQQ